jgi:hypothetical protein
MTLQIYAGLTSQTVRFFVQDTSSTSGAGLTGLTSGISGLTAYYTKGGTGSATAITLASQTATGAWTSGGFCAVDGTNMPGVYRLDIPNAALDSEVETIIMLRGATNMAPVCLRVTGRVFASDGVKWGGMVVTGMPMPTYTQPTGFLGATFPTTIASPTNITAATGIVLAPGTHAGARIPFVTLVDTTTVNSDMRGTNNALLAIDYVAPLNTAGTAAAVWNALLATYTISGSFGARVMRLDAASSGNEAKVTGAGHVASDLHELQPGVITAADFSANWLTAAGTAADYITELQTAIGTAANQAIVLDRTAYALTVLAGACSDAQTAAETYTLTIGGNTFTVDYSGLDASGNRGATTLSKV